MIKVLAKFTVDHGQRQLVGNARTCRRQQRRLLNVHENSAYTLLKSVSIPTPPFGVAKTPEEAANIAQKLDSRDLVIKAQVLAGGRGKGHFIGSNVSGVVMCETPEEARDLSSKMLGKMLVTKQTGPAGRICNAVMITTRMFARKELYLSVMMERSFSGPVVIASSQGGVNIEEVAESNPDAITYLPIDIRKGLSCEEAKKIAGTFGIGDADTVSTLILSLYELFVKKDALLLEINPLVLDLYGNFFALDCKCNFDDSASFRQKELFELQDWSQMDPNEARAAKFDMNYIALDGNIGCMVNGAGLAMATMDIIKLHGGEPANFLDVGGTASVEAVTEAFSIITSDPKVESVFVNIFGGIIRCDTIANGIIKACQNLNLKIPVIVRLQGTNVKEGRKLIRESNLKIININDFARAAEASVSLAQINRLAKKFDLEVEISSKPSASEETAC